MVSSFTQIPKVRYVTGSELMGHPPHQFTLLCKVYNRPVPGLLRFQLQ